MPTTRTAAPTATMAGSYIRPVAMMGRPIAEIRGKNEGEGIWMPWPSACASSSPSPHPPRHNGHRPAALILRVLLVPEVIQRMNRGNLREVVGRHRRRQAPLQRPAGPGGRLRPFLA